VKVAISIPDATFERVEREAKQLGVSRSEFFARAAEHWLHALEDSRTTETIDAVLAERGEDENVAFLDRAAAALAGLATQSQT
jgi:metal-responsive CopG/Arc/MetJ family transcriptional regulator